MSQPQTQSPAPHAPPDHWQTLLATGVWRAPLPELGSWTDRLLLRLACAAACRQVRSFRGLGQLVGPGDPYLLAINHSSRREAVYLPALLMLARGGRPVHFLADWNFRLIPGVSYLYARTGAIAVARKPARPAILNRLRDRYRDPSTAYARARDRLLAGAPVAIFPEGTVNREAGRTLRARPGAVRLALETGVPLIPLAVRFAGLRSDGHRIDSWGPMDLIAGPPLPLPPAEDGPVGAALLHRLGGELMAAIARLGGGDGPNPRLDDNPGPANAHPTCQRGRSPC
jgi:1-acyl-sn-glycerol-3-phosphate acyltransferase